MYYLYITILCLSCAYETNYYNFPVSEVFIQKLEKHYFNEDILGKTSQKENERYAIIPAIFKINQLIQ